MSIDWSSLTDQELSDECMAANNESNRRRVRQEAPAKLDRLNRETLDAEGTIDGSDWSPRLGHNAYPIGFRVLHNGSEWENLIPANVWEPGLDPRWWKDLTNVIPEGVWDPYAYEYAVGDEVLYEDKNYKCLLAHTSQHDWTPAVAPSLWVELLNSEGSSTGETVFLGTTSGESPPEVPTLNEWDPNSVSYILDDEVTYEGDTYKCLQGHTSQAGWDPLTVASLWAIVPAV